jgi:hypothetical protein
VRKVALSPLTQRLLAGGGAGALGGALVGGVTEGEGQQLAGALRGGAIGLGAGLLGGGGYHLLQGTPQAKQVAQEAAAAASLPRNAPTSLPHAAAPQAAAPQAAAASLPRNAPTSLPHAAAPQAAAPQAAAPQAAAPQAAAPQAAAPQAAAPQAAAPRGRAQTLKSTLIPNEVSDYEHYRKLNYPDAPAPRGFLKRLDEDMRAFEAAGLIPDKNFRTYSAAETYLGDMSRRSREELLQLKNEGGGAVFQNAVDYMLKKQPSPIVPRRAPAAPPTLQSLPDHPLQEPPMLPMLAPTQKSAAYKIALSPLTQRMLTGAGIGAVGGGVGGAFLSDAPDVKMDALKGALLGAGVGALGGGTYHAFAGSPAAQAAQAAPYVSTILPSEPVRAPSLVGSGAPFVVGADPMAPLVVGAAPGSAKAVADMAKKATLAYYGLVEKTAMNPLLTGGGIALAGAALPMMQKTEEGPLLRAMRNRPTNKTASTRGAILGGFAGGLGGLGYGALHGGVTGAVTAEDGQAAEGTLSGALKGSLAGAGIGALGGAALGGYGGHKLQQLLEHLEARDLKDAWNAAASRAR